MYKWLVNSIFGKTGGVFYIAHIKKPLIFLNEGFAIFNIADMQWYYFYDELYNFFGIDQNKLYSDSKNIIQDIMKFFSND